jgi:hypothetical protein
MRALASTTRKARQTNTANTANTVTTKTKTQESTPSTSTNTSTSTSTSTMEQANAASNDEWRRFGQARRKELVEKDVLAGGTSFHLNENCRIQRYFQLSDRVSKADVTLLRWMYR